VISLNYLRGGTMKKFVLALGLLPLAVSQAHAGEFTAEPSATVYWQVPLSASQTGTERQAFGFRMDQSVRDYSGNLVSSFSAPRYAPAVDFRFNDKGLRGIYVHGVNMASPAIMRVAGGDDMVWWIVGGTLAGMAGLAVWADDKGGTECPPTTNGTDLLNAVAAGCEVAAVR
jgi:hypothetical protein